jgi:hypothetical protein
MISDDMQKTIDDVLLAIRQDLGRIRVCPYCHSEISPQQTTKHLLADCPSAPPDILDRIKMAKAEVAWAFDIVRKRARYKKRAETLDEYEARLIIFGKRVAREGDYDLGLSDTVARVMVRMNKIQRHHADKATDE